MGKVQKNVLGRDGLRCVLRSGCRRNVLELRIRATLAGLADSVVPDCRVRLRHGSVIRSAGVEKVFAWRRASGNTTFQPFCH